MGYHQAGWEVVGVDLAAQPRYPFEFIRMDALACLAAWFDGSGRHAHFDAIHASPPCQAFSAAAVLNPDAEHPDLVGATRAALQRAGLPWIIENVPGAPMRADVTLCGTMFNLHADGFGLRRHRWFEVSSPDLVPPTRRRCEHFLPAMPVFGHSPNGDWMKRYGRSMPSDLRARAMGIDWMNRNELSEAIPPAYTRHLGQHLTRCVDPR